MAQDLTIVVAGHGLWSFIFVELPVADCRKRYANLSERKTPSQALPPQG